MEGEAQCVPVGGQTVAGRNSAFLAWHASRVGSRPLRTQCALLPRKMSRERLGRAGTRVLGALAASFTLEMFCDAPHLEAKLL